MCFRPINRKAGQLGLIIILLLTFILFVQRATARRYEATYLTQTDSFAYLPLIYVAPSNVPVDDWLSYVNYYRAMAKLPAVAGNLDWAYGNELHGRYSVKNDILIHDEDPANTWYTAEGQQAARSSNLVGSFDPGGAFDSSIDVWMQAPFHAIGILDPQLSEVGYGEYSEAGSQGLQFAAGLDVIRGLDTAQASYTFPVMWPAPDTSVQLAEHWGESPSPLSSCPGYTEPSGLPLLLQIGLGELTPAVTAHSFTRNGVNFEHCIFDETSYMHPDNASQELGRNILDSRDAIVLIPREPLVPGATYHISITVNGSKVEWSFTVSDNARAVKMKPFGLPPVPTFEP
jgi:hypothetical protein